MPRKIGASPVSSYNELMRVRVLFFGQLREITGFAEDYAELSEGARIEDLYERYGRRFPAPARISRQRRRFDQSGIFEFPLAALHRR